MVDVILYGENLEAVIMYETFMIEMQMEEAVSVFGVVSLWVVFPCGTVNDQTYRDHIFDAYVAAISDDFLLQDDNTILHKGRIMDDYLQK